MDRAALAFALVACGARTDVGGARPDASVAADASKDVATDVAPSKCPPVEYTNDEQSSTVFAIDDAAVYFVQGSCDLTAKTKDGAALPGFTMTPDCTGEI